LKKEHFVMRFEAGNLSTLTTATAGAPLVAIRAPATESCKLYELGVTLVAATSTRLALARATTVSVTPGTTIAGQNKTPLAPVSGTLLVSSWGTVPVVGASFFRRITLPAAIGAGYIWTWPADDPLIVGNGVAIGEICIVNTVAVACSLFDWYARWED
jgi:hypothetical protein